MGRFERPSGRVAFWPERADVGARPAADGKPIKEARMIDAARDELATNRRHAARACQTWGSSILIAIVLVWTLAMAVSLRYGFLDRFVAGALPGGLGLDFFCAPRGFDNLISGSNIYLTEMSPYGSNCSAFLSHPMVAVAVGPWTLPFAPWTAFGLFVAVSVVLLAVSAGIIAYQLEGRLLRAFTLFALFCSPLIYKLLWVGQTHVVLILAVALMLAGLVGLERDQPSSTRSLRMLQIGLLISLLSKPVALIAVPVLFATRETRRALVLPVVAYVAVSMLFLLAPPLNRGGYNGFHWINMLAASSSPTPTFFLAFPQKLELAEVPEVYSLPIYLYRLTGTPVPGVLLKLPLLAILVVSGLPLFLTSRRRRIHVLVATVMLVLLSHFLCYYMVSEYQYTTLLPMLPILWWLSQREDQPGLRWPLWIAFVVLLANFLPTLNFLEPAPAVKYLASNTLIRVVPVAVAFVCLMLYCVGNLWVALRQGWDQIELPRGQLADLSRTAAALTLSIAFLFASVWFSVPDRLKKPIDQWGNAEWMAHFKDLISRPNQGLDVARKATLHLCLAEQYLETDKPAALRQYAEAVDLASAYPILLRGLGDRILSSGNVELAISVYRRALDVAPDDQAVQARIRELEEAKRRHP